jgi:hypothetical protein
MTFKKAVIKKILSLQKRGAVFLQPLFTKLIFLLVYNFTSFTTFRLSPCITSIKYTPLLHLTASIFKVLLAAVF